MADATILVLDDDEALLVVLTLLIRREGYRVLTAATAEEAFSLLERERVSVAIVDQNLPDVQGVDVLKRLRQRWPDTIRIMLTASADNRTAVAAINDGHVYRYMTKPWDNDEFRAVLRESVQYYDLLRENRRLYELSISQALQLRALNEALEKKVAERTAEIAAKNLQLEENLLDVVRLLTSAQELRNSSMAGRAQRVAEAARWLTRTLQLSEEDQRNVELAASLHDIGKLGMPDRVFHRDTFSLSREDQDLIKQAPLLGAGLLATIPSLTGVALIVRHQGEWYNGRGYPDGLAGEAIPLGARILAVVDSYSAIMDRRVYKDARSHTEAAAELRKHAGTQFDPEVVAVFLKTRGEAA